jgi:hypothetical protein
MGEHHYRSDQRALKITLGGAMLFLSACQSAPEPVSAQKLQGLTDAACICNRTAKEQSQYDDERPTRCWQEFDIALKTTKWAYMSAAADGPTSSAGMCVGTDESPDSCTGGERVWIMRSLGACSETEARDRMQRFTACLKTKGGDEIACANAL